MEHIWNDHKDHPSQHENSHKLCNEMGHPLSEFDRKSMETEITAWSQFPYDGKVIAEQKLVPKERKKFKRAGLRVAVWGLKRNINHPSKIIYNSSPGLSVPPE